MTGTGAEAFAALVRVAATSARTGPLTCLLLTPFLLSSCRASDSATTAGQPAPRSPAVTAAATSRPPSAGADPVLAAPRSPSATPVDPTASVPRLAPAGPAPGGAPAEEGEEETGAVRLADAVDCVDVEPQEPLPAVREQLSCRRGLDRVYVLTFSTPTDRDTYLGTDSPVVPGGWNVVGPSWVLNVEPREAALGMQRRLGGVVRRGRS